VKREIDHRRESEFRRSTPERARSALRRRLYLMSDEKLERTLRDLRELWNEINNHIKQETGQSLLEILAQQAAERVADGRSSIEAVREYVSRIAPDWPDRAGLVQALQVHFPDEKFEPVMFKQEWCTAYNNKAVKVYEQIEARHRELVEHLEWGDGTAKERIEELLLGAELEAAEESWGGNQPVEKRLREQKIEAIIWFLEKLLRPLSVSLKGAATQLMKEHEARTVKRGKWVGSTATCTPVTGIAPLLDILPF
jgi:hypothetical protein